MHFIKAKKMEETESVFLNVSLEVYYKNKIIGSYNEN